MTHKRTPIIGITCTEIQASQSGPPPRLAQNHSYVHALLTAGGAPVLIPHIADKSLLRTVYEQLDGLLLPGGKDVDPNHYGESPHEKLGNIDPLQDQTEITLTRWAVDDHLPLLAICRGIQVLNVALEGTLYQDIQTQIPTAVKHNWNSGYPRDHLPHSISIVPESRLARIVGTTSFLVNSLHHQSIKRTASRLTVTARAPDQVIESVEANDHPFAIAVQWHPEELIANHSHARRLFTALINACQQ